MSNTEKSEIKQSIPIQADRSNANYNLRCQNSVLKQTALSNKYVPCRGTMLHCQVLFAGPRCKGDITSSESNLQTGPNNGYCPF
jgi:hypothetical protein